MNREDIIRMAQKVGLDSDKIDDKQGVLWLITMNDLERFAALIEQHLIKSGYRRCAEGQRTTQWCGMVEEAVKAEREAMQKIAEAELPNTAMLASMPPQSSAAWNILQAIRKRGVRYD